MHLAINLLDHFKSKPSAAIWNVSSVLGYNPFSVINPVYNGTKAWLHFHTLNMRTQLKDTNIKILEIAPPSVGTDLHRERSDPDDNKKHKNPNALTVEEFMEEIKPAIREDKDTVSAGMGVKLIETWNENFGKQYEKMTAN
jgi:short-subunit dehydrogenase involved in D-alanine esterification of teichoic acids